MMNQNVGQVIALCWLLAIAPTIPLWFDTTIEEAINNGCKCYLPLNNVRQLDAQLSVPNQCNLCVYRCSSIIDCILYRRRGSSGSQPLAAFSPASSS
jgi:hypothetical protein